MSKTWGEWDEEIDAMDKATVVRMKTALDELLSWDFFKEAYSGHGLELVSSFLRNELNRREIKKASTDEIKGTARPDIIKFEF